MSNPIAWLSSVEGGPRRVNHAAAPIGHRIYLFGGYCSTAQETTNGGAGNLKERPIDIFSLNTRNLRWSKVRVENNNEDGFYPTEQPYMRYGHAVVSYHNYIYLWGGRNDVQGSCNKMWRFSGHDHSWKLIQTAGDEPSGRDGHSMTRWKDKIVIFAGYDSDIESYSNETHFFDIPTSTWTRVICTGTPARWRDFHTAAEIDSKLYIFGGRADIFGQVQSNQDFYCNKLKYLDMVTLCWHEVPNPTDDPPGRRSHASFVFKDKMFIFGGFNAREAKHYNDMWCYDPKNQKWSEVHGFGKKPSARRRHTAVCIGSQVFISGGTSPITDDLSSQYDLVQKDETEQLQDHDQTIVVELEPTLNTICIVNILSNCDNLDLSILPEILRSQIYNLSEPNSIAINDRQNG